MGKQLQLTLAELIARSLVSKQLHWSVTGESFSAPAGTSTIGMPPDGIAAAVTELADLRPVDPGFTEVESAIERLYGQLSDVARRVRRRSELLGALDAVSQDMLVDVSRELDEQLWMLRSQLPD